MLWSKVQGGELYSSSYMHLQFNLLSHNVQHLKLITPELFLFQVIENFKSEMSNKMHNPLFSHQGMLI